MSEEFLTATQVTEQWPFLPAATLRYWRHANQGPPSFRAGSRVLYRRTEIERWLEAQERATRRGDYTSVAAERTADQKSESVRAGQSGE